MFDENWEYNFFIENMDGNAKCIVCLGQNYSFFFLVKINYEASHGLFDDIKGKDWTLKLLQFKANNFFNSWLTKRIYQITIISHLRTINNEILVAVSIRHHIQLL